MDKKIEKLLALYKDKSITIEEKRSIAVKLVDMGVLQVSAPQHSGLRYEILYMKLKQEFLELVREYNGVSKRCDMIMRDNLDSFNRERFIKEELLLCKENELNTKKTITKLTIFLLISLTIMTITILN